MRWANSITRARGAVARVAVAFGLCGCALPTRGTVGVRGAAFPMTELLLNLSARSRPVAITVRGTLDGHPVRFDIDTGSDGHTIAAWAVRRFGVATFASQRVHMGQNTSTLSTEATRATVTIDGVGALPPGAIDVVDLPPMYESLGWAGVLSPQRLATLDREVVLDLVEGEMSLRPRAAADAVLARRAAVLAGDAVVCPGADNGRGYVVDAEVEGVGARLLVDSGSTSTEVLTGSEAEVRLHDRFRPWRSRGTTVGGEVPMEFVEGVDVRVGEVRSEITMMRVERLPALCGIQGVLGLDVLQDCALALGLDRARVRCARPP